MQPVGESVQSAAALLEGAAEKYRAGELGAGDDLVGSALTLLRVAGRPAAEPEELGAPTWATWARWHRETV